MITIAHSPDADDYFMFWALRTGALRLEGEEFELEAYDTQDLNDLAKREAKDICAISTAVYPRIREHYRILSSGMSVGRDYGPALVAREEIALSGLNEKRIGIPGRDTTAALLLRRVAPDAETIEIPLTPYTRVFEELDSGAVDAAVLIHEGQIAFAERNLVRLCDLGKVWFEATGLPLALGVNVIHRRLGDARIAAISKLLRDCARFAVTHRAEILPVLFEQSQRSQGKLRSLEELDRYLGMYANEDSLEASGDTRASIAALLGFEPEYA